MPSAPTLAFDYKGFFLDAGAPCNVARALQSIFFGIKPQDPYTAANDFLSITGVTREAQQEFLKLDGTGECAAVKLLRSIVRCVAKGEQPDALFRGLLADRDNSDLLKRPADELIEPVYEFFGFTRGEVTLSRGLTVSVPQALSWTDRSRLGVTIVGQNSASRLVFKLRLTEQVAPDKSKEWNIGIVSQDTERGRIPQELRYRYYPGENCRAGPMLLSAAGLAALLNTAEHFNVYTLDLTPSYYHLYHAIIGLGAEPDRACPYYAEDCSHLERIEKALDSMSINSLRARSWAVEEGRVTDLENGQVLRWHYPRVICRGASATSTQRCD